jgi:putative acetyltransferase
MSTVSIRPYKPSDTATLIKLFRDAVRAINIKHYSPEQISVWAPDDIDEEKWQQKLSKMITFVAEIEGTAVGFVSMTHEGYLDHLYVHKDYQARWISIYLFRVIEKAARELGLAKITTDCSITAKVPSERMGFKVIKEQIIEREGIKLINYRMEKKL